MATLCNGVNVYFEKNKKEESVETVEHNKSDPEVAPRRQSCGWQ